jgi:TPP-dependent 2-oxoacid decarboxylase
VTKYVESSDCQVLLGTFMTDVNLGICTAHLERGRSISITSEKVMIRYHNYEGLRIEHFMSGLVDADWRPRKAGNIPRPPEPKQPEPVKGRKIKVDYLFQRINAVLDDNTIVIADPGDAMFASVDMVIPGCTEFISPAYYTSLGFAVPAGLGAQMARPDSRVLVLVGDGAFQMTGMELSTIVRFGLNPVIIVLNNEGYGTERPMLDGRFNDVLSWKYSKIPEVLGAGTGFDVKTEDQFEEALQAAFLNNKSFTILDVQLDPKDISQALQRLTSTLGKRVK